MCLPSESVPHTHAIPRSNTNTSKPQHSPPSHTPNPLGSISIPCKSKTRNAESEQRQKNPEPAKTGVRRHAMFQTVILILRQTRNNLSKSIRKPDDSRLTPVDFFRFRYDASIVIEYTMHAERSDIRLIIYINVAESPKISAERVERCTRTTKIERCIRTPPRLTTPPVLLT